MIISPTESIHFYEIKKLRFENFKKIFHEIDFFEVW